MAAWLVPNGARAAHAHGAALAVLDLHWLEARCGHTERDARCSEGPRPCRLTRYATPGETRAVGCGRLSQGQTMRAEGRHVPHMSPFTVELILTAVHCLLIGRPRAPSSPTAREMPRGVAVASIARLPSSTDDPRASGSTADRHPPVAFSPSPRAMRDVGRCGEMREIWGDVAPSPRAMRPSPLSPLQTPAKVGPSVLLPALVRMRVFLC